MRLMMRFLVACLLLGACGAILLGQSATGNIIGHVTDSTGAVIPGASVTAINPAKGQRFHTVTDEHKESFVFIIWPLQRIR